MRIGFRPGCGVVLPTQKSMRMPTASQDAIRIIVVDGIGASRQRLARLLLPAEDIEVAALAPRGAASPAPASPLPATIDVVAATGAGDSLPIIEKPKQS